MVDMILCLLCLYNNLFETLTGTFSIDKLIVLQQEPSPVPCLERISGPLEQIS